MKMNNNLRTLRREAKLTQVALQMKTGIEQALISKYESGSASRQRKRWCCWLIFMM